MSDFHPFATAVHKRYTELSKNELYVIDLPGDDLVAAYLAAFPEGTNPIYRTNTEHDCSCCKNFIRNLGLVVGLIDGKPVSVWGVQGLESPYKEVAAALDALVLSTPLKTIFRSEEKNYGHESNTQLLPDGTTKRWNHFHGAVAKRHFSLTPDKDVGEFNAKLHVFKRGLVELSADAMQQVIDLIEAESLYRGEEHLPAVQGFKTMQSKFDALALNNKPTFLFENADSKGSKFRNSVIGVLVQDLSEGMDLEGAVKKFESMVAPANYKRTTALITPRMIADATKKIAELGLGDALQRRLATLRDVSVNDVLWVDSEDRALMKDSMTTLLMGAVKSKQAPTTGATDISIADFMANIVPTAQSMEMHLQHAHLANFVTLTAPVHAGEPRLFKWSNDFGWSYDGNVTDSIREKVKKAGGDVDAKLRFSLAWFNHDDLDFHVKTPDGTHIYFGDKRGGHLHQVLDVDMNMGRGTTREPVENLSFRAPRDGDYALWVNQYSRRETTDIGYVVEVAHQGGVFQLSCNQGLNSGESRAVGTFTVKAGTITGMKVSSLMLPGGVASEKWGVKTEQGTRVKTLMLSPNHWGENAVGNKHWIFVLEGCKTDEPARGIYNEFLRFDLEQHRKVFEVLGDKTKCPITQDQLSGLGFSSTRGDTVAVTVKSDRGNRRFNIKF